MSDTQSVLDQMTAGIMDRKEAKATGLTPVGLEIRPAIAEAVGDIFPHDGGLRSQLLHSIRIIRHELVTVEECLRSVEREVGLQEGGATPPAPIVNAKEAARLAQQEIADAADKEFKRRFAEQSKDAQEQAFPTLDEPGAGVAYPPLDEPVEEDEPSSDWACPVHGAGRVHTLKSRKGRKYRACKTCDQFERS